MINERRPIPWYEASAPSGLSTSRSSWRDQSHGPLELATFMGLDTCLAIMIRAGMTGLADTKIPPLPLADKIRGSRLALGRKIANADFMIIAATQVPTR